MSSRARDRGFVLVGVVMFVLALTILGLSLFTLSSYEAQSLTQSHARQQGSYDAESGIEMVKALIMTPPNYSLASAATAVGSFNVVGAVAKQHRSGGTWDSTGTIQGDSTVLIQVTSQNYGERRTLEARFRPKTQFDYYKRLFTVANSVIVENLEIYPPPVGTIVHPAAQLRLSGRCWQFVDSAADTAWLASQTTWTGPTFENTGPVTMPSIINYVANHPIGYTAIPTALNANEDQINFTQHPIGTAVAYYRVPQNLLPGLPQFSYTAQKRITLNVRGTVVWILPAGIQFNARVDIVRETASATLIIVAGAVGGGGLTDDYGIHFKGGVTTGTVNPTTVLLASDARVVIEFVNQNNNYSGDLPELSVLCRDLQLMGPATGAYALTLGYKQSTMDGVIDGLYNDSTDPLPRPAGSTSSLTLVRGSWRSATP